MSRHVDADALLTALYDADAITPRGAKIIREFPVEELAADVVEVVRCRNCEHNYGTQKAPRCDFTEFKLTPNSYCSCGFKKMGESGAKMKGGQHE